MPMSRSLIALFALFDRDHDGRLSLDEFKSMVRHVVAMEVYGTSAEPYDGLDPLRELEAPIGKPPTLTPTLNAVRGEGEGSLSLLDIEY